MPPKRSDLHHVTFHFYKSAVLLSVPTSTQVTINSLKTQLLPALKPFAQVLPVDIPSQTSDFQIWVEKAAVEGSQGAETDIVNLEEEKGNMSKTVGSLGWQRWKKAFVSFRGEDGEFFKPEYTIPNVDDGEAEGE